MSSHKFTNKLQNKRILIFGGTSGIGFAIAEAAIEFGANVIISGSNAERLAKTVSRLQESYPDTKPERISTFVCDLDDVDTLESKLTEEFDKLTNRGTSKIDHIAITAGGAAAKVPLVQITVENLRQSMDMRVIAPILIAKLVPKYLNVSSASSLTFTTGSLVARPEKGFALVAAFGGAIEALTRSLAVDLAPVRVNIVNPGFVDTERTKGMISMMGKDTLAKFTTITGKLGEPEDLAEAYLYIMRDKFTTANYLTSDGGRIMTGPSPS